jgi:hypothetical protein
MAVLDKGCVALMDGVLNVSAGYVLCVWFDGTPTALGVVFKGIGGSGSGKCQSLCNQRDDFPL